MFSLQELQDRTLLRELKVIEQRTPYLFHEGKRYLNFSSNDYLALSSRLDLQEEFFHQRSHDRRFVMGSLSSRLLTGNSIEMFEFESFLARSYGREAALLFPSGYHANIGILPALANKRDLIIADKKVHASIIDGLKLGAARWMRFRHNDYEDLVRLLERHRAEFENVFIVVESIYSMDGDLSDLAALVEIKKAYRALLYVDEAHAIGVRGEHGLGLAEENHLIGDIDLIVCTLGKAIASEGAYVISSEEVKQYLINQARSFIYTTAMSPMSVMWTRFVFERMMSMQAEREQIVRLSQYCRTILANFDLLGESHIVPLFIGTESHCVSLGEKLKKRGLWALPIRYPTVPLGQARIRLSLHAGFTNAHLDLLYEALLDSQNE